MTATATQIARQFCRKCIQSCVPAVTLTFDGGTRRLHWCAEHVADADQYRADADTDIADTTVAGRRLGDYKAIREFPGHFHSHPDDIVGYVVRETIRDGVVLWHGEETVRHGITVWSECGYDVATVEGSTRYGDTFEVRDSYRTAAGGYAVVDTLYSCGCRS